MHLSDIIVITIAFKLLQAKTTVNMSQLANYNLIQYIFNPMIKTNQGYVKFNQNRLLVSINTFNKVFNIIVYKQVFKSLEIVNKNGVHCQKISYYQGKLLDDPNSEVIGYLINSSFVGIISTKDHLYHIESFNLSHPLLVIIYRESDVSYNSQLNKSDMYPGLYVMNKLKRFKKSSQEEYNYEHKVCEIELVADHTFTYHHSKNIANIVTEMIIRFRQVNSILESTDFNKDKKADRFGLRIKKIVVYMTSKAKVYFLAKTDLSPEQVLQNFSKRIQKHCLAVLFTFRQFSSSVLGLAYTASASANHVGGLCQKPTRSFQTNDKNIVSYNTLIVTDRIGGQRLLRSHSVLTLFHELGHSLGGLHDTYECEPRDKNRYFIMHPKIVSANNIILKLSSCSLSSIRKVLEAKGSCLKARSNNTCGDMVVDKNEECDCGDNKVCHLIDPCCVPAGRPGECRLKRNAQCSQQQGLCDNN